MTKPSRPNQFFLIQNNHVVLVSSSMTIAKMLKQLHDGGWSVDFKRAETATTLDLLSKGYVVAAILSRSAKAVIFTQT